MMNEAGNGHLEICQPLEDSIEKSDSLITNREIRIIQTITGSLLIFRILRGKVSFVPIKKFLKILFKFRSLVSGNTPSFNWIRLIFEILKKKSVMGNLASYGLRIQTSEKFVKKNLK